MIKDKLIKGSTIINGLDLSELGMFMIQNGGDNLLLFPERKQPKSNNWYEYDGLDVDLSEIYFNDRALAIQFYIYSDNARDYEFNLNEFYKLTSNDYITLYSREFNKSFKLRYIACGDYVHTGGLYKDDDKGGTMKIQFSMDDPLQLFTNPTILQPKSPGYNYTSYILLNGIDLGKFGIVVNEAYSSMLKLPAVKPPLIRRFENRSGALAFPRQESTFEAKEITIKCTMRTKDLTTFYYNYEALFNNLSKLEGINLETYLGDASCYYNRMDDFKKLTLFSEEILVSFTLKLVQIDVGITIFILGAEDGTALLTEDNQYIEITR